MLADRIFSTPALDELFSDQSELACMLAFEAALAQAEAEFGVIPASAGELIANICQQTDWDTDSLAEQTLLAGNPAIPFVRMLTQRVATQSAEAATYVHWGATSQDVMDTALVLQLKQALEGFRQDLNQLQHQLATLARAHRQTLMMGRTLVQQARPITFGYKVAGWLEPLIRSGHRLERLQSQNLTLQFGGAVGTLATLPETGATVAAHMAEQLGLKNPPMPWHSQRDNLVEIATTLGILNGSLGKLAQDIVLMMQTEVAELFEGAAEGKGGSSAMPHKRNPVSSTFMLAITAQIPALVSSLLSAMVQEHERAAGAWHSEWVTIRTLIKRTGANLHHAKELIAGLEVDVNRMRQNIDRTQGLIFAEDITAALSPGMGKATARQLVEQACQQTRSAGMPLQQYLREHTNVSHWLSPSELDNLFDPQRAVGMSHFFLDEVLKQVS